MVQIYNNYLRTKTRSVENQLKQFFAHCLKDIQVECNEEFDRNFERKAFFSEAWQRRSGAYHDDKPLLAHTWEEKKYRLY